MNLKKSIAAVAMVNLGSLAAGHVQALDIPYSVQTGPENFTGTVHLTNGLQADSVDGIAVGPANGAYRLDATHTHTEYVSSPVGPGIKVNVNFDFGPQRLSARIDTCPILPNSCNSGSWVILWQK